MGFPRDDIDRLAGYLRSVRSVPPRPPRALLVVSAHWEEHVPTVMTSEHPPILYDYYGFPPESYTITWPAPGAPDLASRVQELLNHAGIANASDGERGFDHGTFIPLKLTYPNADVPAIQLSLKHGLDPAEHIALGRALQPLRDEDVFIIGSGMTFHNLRAFRDPRAAPVAETFDAWLRESMTLAADARNERLTQWESAPGARGAHPREEHLIPLMVASGAAGDQRAVVAFNDTFTGLRLSAYHFGVN
jgi:aromatic ring-opening dioxygenase catalytic subunit (LigB family)